MPVPNQQFTPHFSLQEMLLSQTAVRFRYDEQFEPADVIIENLRSLCQIIIEPLRHSLGQPIKVTSGYRCLRVNTRIKGSKTSQHMQGEAADINVLSMTIEGLFQLIKQSGLPFDQLIQEFDAWVHVSFHANPRGQVLRAIKLGNGQTKYLPG